MRKLIRGILEFRRTARPAYVKRFAKLATGQSPDALFIACSDSRVVPNLFASTDPGDLFVVRNVGNFVGSEDAAAAIEFSLDVLKVTDLIVCGHSECGAMSALLKGRSRLSMPHLRSWLRDGEPALTALEKGYAPDASLERHNQLSQLNVLAQLERLRAYPIVQRAAKAGQLQLHGWWFELRGADVYAFDEDQKRFKLIDKSLLGSVKSS